MKRRHSKSVRVGKVTIGGNAPVSIQSMTKTDTRDVGATVREIKRLKRCGCEIIRVACRDEESLQAVKKIKKRISIPLVVDIHFNWKLAIGAIEAGADKIRINPGNITSRVQLKEIALRAKDKKVPIRIGVNSGSAKTSLVSAALKAVRFFESVRFTDLVISLKSSSVEETVQSYRQIARRCNYPLHLGVTAAGVSPQAEIKSAIGIGTLLLDGIGDTIRVSIAGDPAEEVTCGQRILKALGLRHFGPELIACPTCGRCEIDVVKIAKQVERRITHNAKRTTKPLRIAVMGCIVNGPGEAKEADFGIAGGKHCGIIFKHGKVVKRVSEAKLVDSLIKLIKR